MRIYFISLLFILWNQGLAQKNIRFELHNFPLESAAYIGIRGSVEPLSWERTLYLKQEASGNPFIVLDFEEETELLEYKFVLDKKGKLEWEGIENRAELLAGDSFTFTSEWNKAKFIDPATLPWLSAEELQEDYQVIAQAIEKIHPGLYRYNDSMGVKKHLAELNASFQTPKTYGEAFLSLAKFAASIQCDHTYASLWNQEAIITSLLHRQKDKLPFTFQWINRRMILTHNAAEASALKRGTEIMSINGVPVEEILDKMLPYISADGATTHNKIRKAEIDGYGFRYNGFDGLYALLFPIKENQVVLRFRNPSESEAELSVKTVSREEREKVLLHRYPQFPRSPQDLWSYRIIDKHIAYLQIGSFDTDSFSEDWRQLLKDAFKTFDKAKVKHLILDIRENQGGLDEAGDELLKYLAKKPCGLSSLEGKTRFLTFPEEVKANIKTWDYWFYNLSQQTHEKRGIYYVFPEENAALSLKPSPKSFAGNIVLLTSAKNVSGAFYMARTVRECGMGTLIGQETGGNQNGINGGSILFLKPPHSRINIDLPVMGMFAKEKMPNRGIVPDIEVKKQANAVGREIDVELQAALEYLQKLNKE